MIMIFLFLFVGVCTCEALTPPPPTPQYTQMQVDLTRLEGILKENIISMAGNIPNLSNHKRHYAEIFHVIYNEASSLSGCLLLPYKENYQKLINGTASQGISEPQLVIDEAQTLLEQIKNRTDMVQKIVDSVCILRNGNCDQLIDEKLHGIVGPISGQIPAYLAAGKAAGTIVNKHNEFLEVSKSHSSVQYVIEGVDKLSEASHELANLLRQLHKSVGRC